MTLIATCICVLANLAWGYYATHAIVYPHVHVHTFAHIHVHVWQSRVEIEGYSIVYFDHIAAFEAPYH